MIIEWDEFETQCYCCGKIIVVKKENDKLREREFKERNPNLDMDTTERAYTCDDCDKEYMKWFETLNKCPKCENKLSKTYIKNDIAFEKCPICQYEQERKENNIWNKNLRTWTKLS